MGSGIMQCWINGATAGGIDDKIKMANIIVATVIAFAYPISSRMHADIRQAIAQRQAGYQAAKTGTNPSIKG